MAIKSVRQDFGILLIRLGLGAFMVLHGAPRVVGGTERWERLGLLMADWGLSGLAILFGLFLALCELVGGAFFLVGVFFRPSAVLLSILMALEAFRSIQLQENLWSVLHAAELSLVFAGMALIGSGKFAARRS